MNEKKRSATTPIHSEKTKESRQEEKLVSGQVTGEGLGVADVDPSQDATGTNNLSRSVSQMSVSSTSQSSWREESDGPMKISFTVDFATQDGQPYRGQITRKEAVEKVFIKALGFKLSDLHGVTPGYRGNPFVVFKMRRQFNIDEILKGKSRFSYQRKSTQDDGTEKVSNIGCLIKGIREPEQVPGERLQSRYTWIKIEGAEYQLTEAQVRDWVTEYGSIVEDISEDVERFEGSSGSESEANGLKEEGEIHTGVYSVKIIMRKPIPQLIPMCGKKIRIYYKNIKKLCTNCFEQNHNKYNCNSERREWLAYVNQFVIQNKLPDEYYGSWIKRLEDWRRKNPEHHQYHLDEVQSADSYLKQQALAVKKTMDENDNREQTFRANRSPTVPMNEPEVGNRQLKAKDVKGKVDEKNSATKNAGDDDDDEDTAVEESDEQGDGFSTVTRKKLNKKPDLNKMTETELARYLRVKRAEIKKSVISKPVGRPRKNSA